MKSKNLDPCKIDGCETKAHSRGLCSTHNSQRARDPKLATKQCHIEGCQNHQDDGRRRGPYRGSKRVLCRVHEHLHLIEHAVDPTQNEAVEQWNRETLARGIVPVGKCWMFTGSSVNASGYPMTFTHNSGGVEWLGHRVAWGLLMRGHAPRRDLDHLSGCQGKGCISPAHLEPVTNAMNQNRKAARKKWREGKEPYRVRECGPRFNRKAAADPRVIQFAQEYDLPLPVVDG